MMAEIWGKMPDGAGVHRHRLTGGGLSACVLSYGAVIQDLRLGGHAPALVLGFDDFAAYLTNSPYFGAIAGRCANRIRDGHLLLDGVTHQLDRNFDGKHMLHGGAAGIGKRLWQVEAAAVDAITLRIDLSDGEMGFPGNMVARCRYALTGDGVLDVRLTAETDRTTLCNLAHHSYFKLDGAKTILDHELQVDAPTYLPVDGELIPTGKIVDVAGTEFDFRQPLRLRQAGDAGVIDHNLCLSEKRVGLRRVATLASPQSGVEMEIRTTEPGLQVYTGSKISIPMPGLDGRHMGAFAGIALEPQVWPDATHHPQFPQAVLRPGEVYDQQTQYVFRKDRS